MKQALRETIWEEMSAAKLGAFPFPLKGRIPNFKGASEAAKRLFDHAVWQQATVVKANPDAPQRAVRKQALLDGKTLYMAVPRLTEKQCFVEISVPPKLAAKASTIKGAFTYGRQIHPRHMQRVDLVIAGSVAVNDRGERVGKGGGFSDLELAIGHAFGILDENSRFVSTVHDIQLREGGLPQEPHDSLMDWIFTPTRTVACTKQRARPQGILWQALSEEKRKAVPILEDLDKP